jgi:hypothetical protein
MRHINWVHTYYSVYCKTLSQDCLQSSDLPDDNTYSAEPPNYDHAITHTSNHQPADEISLTHDTFTNPPPSYNEIMKKNLVTRLPSIFCLNYTIATNTAMFSSFLVYFHCV